MKRLLISSLGPVALAAAALSCVAGCASHAAQVTQYGGMREVLREGRSQPRVSLVVGPPESGDEATILTLTHVERWRDASLTTAASGTELETVIESIARAAGVNVAEPFPFVIEGDLTARRWERSSGSTRPGERVR